MKLIRTSLLLAIAAAIAPRCYAVMPPMPGMTSGSGSNGMKHVLLSQPGGGPALAVHVSDPPPTPVVMMSGHGTDYTYTPMGGEAFPDPGKFDVLEDVYFNAQHGWLPDGPFNLPSGGLIWIERTAATQPAGSEFRVYEGGNGAEGMGAWSMEEVYAADGDRWQWDGAMQHDYFTADRVGDYSMSFDIYVGDATGAPISGIASTSTTLSFRVVPEPASAGLVVLGAAVVFGRRRRGVLPAALAVALLLGVPGGEATAGYVLPQLGGGQAAWGTVAMKHIDVSFDGVNLSAHVDGSVATPVLTPLEDPDEFDPAMPFAVLQEKAYNLQYGWNPSGFWAPPAGTAVWVKRLAGPAELEAYFVDGWPSLTPYSPILGTEGSADIWKWGLSMTHNAYAVLNPTQSSYEVEYELYIGDAVTGAAVPGYGSALTTLVFDATPVLRADFDGDGDVDAEDLQQWRGDFGVNGDSDSDADLDSDLVDVLAWQREFNAQASIVAVAEPGTLAAAMVALGCCVQRAR